MEKAEKPPRTLDLKEEIEAARSLFIIGSIGFGAVTIFSWWCAFAAFKQKHEFTILAIVLYCLLFWATIEIRLEIYQLYLRWIR
jgi:hypothetical protein